MTAYDKASFQDGVMNGYFESIGVLIVAIVGVLLGKQFSKLRGPYWLTGYIISLVLIILLIASRYYYDLNFLPPFSYILAGRGRFITLAVAITLGLIAPIDRLKYRIEKIFVCVLMAGAIGWFAVMPFLAPAFLRSSHESMLTRINADGICLQATSYTCGPAAAVTALTHLGIRANEGRLAVLAHSSPIIGTLPTSLAHAINNWYGQLGVDSTFRTFNSIDEMKSADVTLVIVKDHFLTDHCIAVLEVNNRNVIVGDPAFGKQVISREKFAEMWRFSGITVTRSLGAGHFVADLTLGLK